MGVRILAALTVCMVLLGPARADTGADSAEPVVYFFWSATCPYSKAAKTFLQAAQTKDAALRLRDFEVDKSVDNSRLLARLYDRIGLPETRVVPTIVIGHHIIVGYIDDDTTGREILNAVEKCRKVACKDAVRELIETQDHLEATTGSLPPTRVVCDKRPGRTIR
jgi:glutaredoxin